MINDPSGLAEDLCMSFLNSGPVLMTISGHYVFRISGFSLVMILLDSILDEVLQCHLLHFVPSDQN